MSRLINNVHFSAIILVLLTLISTLLAQSNIQENLLALLVTLSVVIKGQQIVDIFMELNKAEAKWRWFLLSYTILIPIILAIIIYF
ncbi:MAG: cytochrome c oxidase subunit 4 [Colwellia sp.]|jgi:cytochrome c oxidase subunit 4|tara:strand:+ start:1639 stop:1896 length:258 start_codon:yes stop_codon:yes gene_type:complete